MCLPNGKYNINFSFNEINEINLATLEKLTSFEIKNSNLYDNIGYINLPATIGCHIVDGKTINLIKNAKGCATYCSTVYQVTPEENWFQPIEIFNNSDEDWIGTYFHPLHLSYHWYLSNKRVVYNGIRTKLPFSNVGCGKSISLAALIQAPKKIGLYHLRILPVQEGHAWLDILGFQPTNIQIEVVSLTSARRFQANDCRLRHSVGNVASNYIESNGLKGFLVFGPYTYLSVGKWSISWFGEFSPGNSAIRADIACNKGSEVLSGISLIQKCDTVTLEIDVIKIITDAEFRLWLDSTSYVRFDAVELKPIMI